ncbi:MAG: GNAT family N-acetyltransferase [Casimicrobiaceae bacterium]
MLPAWWGQGYAFEAASAVLAYGRDILGIRRVVAITSLDNDRSIRLLEALGLTFERMLTIGTSDEELRMYGIGP